jgi:hypothetical protein
MGPIGPAFAAGFGALAALLLIGGGVLLRWQRTRLQFSLMQTALERGTTPLPGIPLWLLSFRQGMMILVLGVGLFVVGGSVHNASENVPMPTAAELAQTPPRPGPPEMGDNDRPPGPPMRGPDEHRFDHQPPHPNESPAVEQWHRAQDQKALGNLAIACGFILALLGFVRIIFAFAERKYSYVSTTV